ncbi:hypothetical protein FAUST_7714 [Fusarium austroamericanum]|uniref:Transcription factor domain-containing protein n=1 Tax=Fusarium austroamericanum TaxID=282268 RepID=A0AAN5Z793_FUSAU|nr:hypothetical protein FAUST_7714 [Fusarium austroamericanum]
MNVRFATNPFQGLTPRHDTLDPVQLEKVVLCYGISNQVKSLALVIIAPGCIFPVTLRSPVLGAQLGKAVAGELPKDGRHSLSFLLQASDPSHNSMDVNVATEPERTLEEPTWSRQESETTGWVPGTVDPKFLLLNLSDMLLDEPLDYESTESDVQFQSIFDPPSATNTLTTRVAALSISLQSMTTNKPHLKEELDYSFQRGFFTVSHFQNAFIIFFRRRHYHKPPIHWPTFDLDEIAPHLLLAAVLTGTAYLQYLDRSSQNPLTASLLEVAEKYIFKEVKRLADQNMTPLASRHMLEVVEELLASEYQHYLLC